ncbi:hypothetical protein PBRA_009537 [Plasmodiophora brassicae]|uniref:Reverse transcriptase domain-containing protein n=1 Tax=Plasmodiophora brassicae TaxID=37360 RepID=A0A0G4J8T9_PLABS|nr:hypothetical protein PBRA_009537 [Plasmodiophora brassicae]
MSFVDCLVYMDDVLVFSQSVEQHFDRIDKVFERLREHGLTVNPKKTYLLQREVTYLGHRVSGDGIQPDARLVQAVTEFPEPTNKAQVRTFLGLAGYYSHLIRKFAEVSAPLSDLVGKASQWRWGEEESEAFRELRRRLSERPLLAHPDFSRPFILQTDWSNTAFGAILCQRDDVGHEHPVAYMSKKCRGAEKQYTSRRGEAVSIRLVVRKWRCFLEGAHFMIETDHRPLEFLRKEQDDAQLCRVWEALEPYDYTLRYKPGASMTNVDALSRVEYRHHQGEPVVDPDLVGQDSEESADEEDQDDDDDVPDVAEALGVQAINVNGRTRPCGRCLVRCIAGLKEAVPNGEADDAAGGPDLAGLRERQRSDPVLRRLIEAKERNEQPNSQLETTTLLDNNGILMKVVSAPRSGEQQRVVLFLPESDRSEQLRRAHDDPVAGHFGQARTVQNLRRTVFWPGMVRDARRYVERCRACQQAKARVPSAQGLRQEFDEDDVPFLPWYSVHVDHVVDLPRTSRGNEHVLTVTCRMCHATLFLPVRRYTAVETAETLIRHVFLQKGFPMKMTADRSRSWRNDLFEAIGKAFGFRLAMTVSYRARGNGMAERPHRYLKAFLRTMSDEDLARWDLQLEYLTFAYCKGVCETTKETPHYLEFGRDIRGPVEYDVQLPEKRVDRSYREYLQRLQRRLRSAWEVAHRMAKEAYGKRVARQNLGRFSPNPEVGQLFWADRRSQATAGEEGEPTRFRSPLTGPWRVLQKLPNTADTYRLRHLYTQEEATFNCDQIVRVFEGEEDGADDDADVDADLGIEEDGDSEVDPELAVLDELVLSAADISDVEDGDPTFAPEGRASTTPDRPQGEQSYNLRSRGGV